MKNLVLLSLTLLLAPSCKHQDTEASSQSTPVATSKPAPEPDSKPKPKQTPEPVAIPEPGSSPCPTCSYCWGTTSGKLCGKLGNSLPDAPKTDFAIKKLTAHYYDASNKELGTSDLSFGNGEEGQPVKGTFTKKADHVYLYWVNAAGDKEKGPGEIQGCTAPCP